MIGCPRSGAHLPEAGHWRDRTPPSGRPCAVRHRFSGLSTAWLLLAAGFELLSCVSYYVVFRAVFAPGFSSPFQSALGVAFTFAAIRLPRRRGGSGPTRREYHYAEPEESGAWWVGGRAERLALRSGGLRVFAETVGK